jgi:hypothetical protein
VGVLFVVAALALLLLSHVGAQATPEETLQETPTRVRISLPDEVIAVGQEFAVEVLVENVEHLAGFDFTIEYDPKLLEPVKATEDGDGEGTPAPSDGLDGTSEFVQVRGEAGEFLATSERGENILCTGPFVRGDENRVSVSCVTLGPPLCLGGQAGASGSGLLGRVVFTSRGDGTTTLKLAQTTLALDDLQPCDPESNTVPIAHNRQDALVELTSGGGLPWVIIGPIIGVGVVVLLGGGLVGFLRYRRRGTGTSA